MGLSREEILEQTDMGLDVILAKVSEAGNGVRNYAYKFKCDHLKVENNPSLGLQKNEAGTEWVIRDWGSDKTWSAFDVVMEFENLDYSNACKWICQHFNLVENGKASRSYEYEKITEGLEDVEVKKREWGYLDDFEMAALKGIFAKHVWEWMGRSPSPPAGMPYHPKGGAGKGDAKGETPGMASVPSKDMVAFERAKEVCLKYGFRPLAWHSLVSIDKKTGQKVKHVFKATETYPMFVWHIAPPAPNGGARSAKTEEIKPIAYKFYEPYGKQRFFYEGVVPKNYLFGLEQVKAAYDDLPNDAEIMDRLGINPEEHDGFVAKMLQEAYDAGHEPNKLPEVLVATGGSDALNMAALGYFPVWANGEHITPEYFPYKKLAEMAWRVINVPDIDAPGKMAAAKLAEHHIEICTAWLPEELAQKRSGKKEEDGSPKFCKDVKDYFGWWKPFDFKRVLAHAKPYKFWTKKVKMEGKIPMKEEGKLLYKYSPRPSYILNFLYRNGFAVLARSRFSGKSREYVRIKGNQVQQILDTADMKNFVDEFVAKHSFDSDLSDSMLRSRDVADAIFARLPEVELDFKDYDKDYQWFFLSNETWKISADKIETFRPEKVNKYVWEHEVLNKSWWDAKAQSRVPVKFEKMEPSFCITVTDEGLYDIKILRKDCIFLNYLIQTSRIHWRVELEDELDKVRFPAFGSAQVAGGETASMPSVQVQSRDEYRERYKFAIDGPLLTESQRQQQKMHLITKLLSIGKMMHRYKSMSTAMAVWSMDYVMRDLSKSQGGTGKSLTPYCLAQVLPTETIAGRDRAALANKHVFENISEDTDMLWLDDADKHTDFSFFYSAITGFMKKNPKGTKSETIGFEDSPQIWITSNFPPIDVDQDSTIRRLWMTEYSDYYHYNQSGEYREVRKPFDDFGKELIRDFDQHDWNSFINTLAVACQSFIKYGYVSSGDDNMRINAYRNKIGVQMIEWFDMFFNKGDGTVDNFLVRKQVFEQYKIDTGSDITSNGFGTKLRDYAAMKGYAYNPVAIEKHRTNDGRVICKQTHEWIYSVREGKWVATQLVTPKALEFFYYQTTPDVPINYANIEEYSPGNAKNKPDELAKEIEERNKGPQLF
ncbi:MAG TPA: hypothetical protein VK175_06100 [Leadbetterella sp.]|nr:hypothetical protein [Leadbetterella sp.]